MSFLKKLLGDFFGLYRILGPFYAFKWIVAILMRLPIVLRQKNLQPADQAMGVGPFRVCFSACVVFHVFGDGVISGVREMYVRDVYLRNGLLTIEDGDVVLDLGANIGNFTNLALAHGKSVKVISVEPSLRLNESYEKSVALNDCFIERTRLIRAFVGQMGEKQEKCILEDDQYRGAGWISEDELVSSNQLSKVDFLKCDIEGGEFSLLCPGSKLLQMTRKIAIEIHQFAGNVDGFINMLITEGFELKYIQREPDGSATVLGIRSCYANIPIE